MKNILTYAGVLILITWLISCDSEDALDCFQKTGEITEHGVILEPFYMVRVQNEVDVYLSNATEQQVVIRAGKNLIPEIKLTVEDGILSIENNNTCQWHRTPGNPGVYIASDLVRKVEIFDYSNIYSVDTLKRDRMDLYSDGTGNFEMTVLVNSMKIESAYISNFMISGEAGFLELNLFNDSRFLARDLAVIDISIMHRGSNLVEVNPQHSLTGTLERTGDIRYYHKPQVLDVLISGTGKILDFSDR